MNMLNDFEKTARFNKEQLKNFGSPKTTGPPQQPVKQQPQYKQQNLAPKGKSTSKHTNGKIVG